MEPLCDRRRHSDRRASPTTLWSTLRWRGRRTGLRRAGAGHRAYVDRLARRVVTLALIVFVGSALDALLTLRYIQDGGGEANPLMAHALAHSHGLFLGWKLSSTGLAVWVLAAHQQWPLAVWSLYGLAIGYGAVLVSHLVLAGRLV